MSVEVIVPCLRQQTVEWLVESLSKQTVAPDAITIVSNETQPFAVWNVPVRLLRFASEAYSIGEYDVALRQNVGLFSATADVVVIQGDDQVAPPSMIEDTLRTLDGKSHLWGNHRLIDFEGKTLDEIRLADPASGISRENPVPPAWHGHWSCYGGMFAARTAFIQSMGGMDMAFNGRHQSEDQQLGYRLMRMEGLQRVFIEEPPFSWHSIELRQGDRRLRSPWLQPKTNGCGIGSHDLMAVSIEGMQFVKCRNCAFLAFDDIPGKLFRDQLVIPYRHELVTTTSVWL